MSIYDSLNDKQREAVYHTEGPLLVLAGAGSGKTRVLTHRVTYLIQEKRVNPWNIMAITFTNKAAGEMRERVNQLVDFGADSIWVSTFHSSCVRMLRRHIQNLGYDTNFSIYDTDDQRTLMRQIIKALNIDTKQFKERALLGYISSAKDDLISPEEFAINAGGDYRMKKVAEVYKEYQKQLRNNNALDFDDLIVKTVELFQNCPEVLEYYQDRFKYIMVDEYQDTNMAQFKLVQLLAGKYRNLCVVGDDDQSIYKFRGANIENILSFEKAFPGAVVIKLEQNYRSTQNILNAANEVIRHNRGRKDKTLWTANEEGEKVILRQFDTAYDEADFIIRDIRNCGMEYQDCAVLYRTNAQSRLLEEKCIAQNVPYRMVGGVNFYQRKEIKDVLSYLKTIANGQDDLAVQRIINVPKRGIGQTTINKVTAYAAEQGIGFYEALREVEEIPSMGKAAGKINAFVSQIQVMKSKLEYFSIQELIEDVLESTGYRSDIQNNDDEIEAETRLQNIEELVNKAVAYEEDAEEPTLHGFLEEVALVADIDSMDASENRIILMTLHSAKGLEFPRVYLSGLEDGLFPSFMSITAVSEGGRNEELEEERRLCYVGITRARELLTITSARQRMVNGETRYSRISRFIEEIPLELLDTAVLDSGFGKKKNRDVDEMEDDSLPWAASGRTQGISTFGAKPNSYGMGSAQDSGRGAVFLEKHTSPYAKVNPFGAASGKAIVSSASAPAAPAFGKAFTVDKSNALDYQVGDKVKHIKYGIGTVSSIEDGGKDYEVTVDFERVGVKRMFASFAKLKKI